MAFLEIIHLSGETEQRPLEKRQPISIGSHSSNDIRIDEESVEPMHCRVSWNKQAFEAVAAGVDGLDFNGTVVQRANLKPGDVLRFGSVDVRFRDSDGDGAPAAAGTPAAAAGGGLSEIDLKPLSGELEVPDWLKPSPQAAVKPPETSSKPKPPSSSPSAKPRKDDSARRAESASPTKPGRSVEGDSGRSSSKDASRKESRHRSAAADSRSPSSRPDQPSKPVKPAPDPAASRPARAPKSEPELDLDEGLEALAAESRSSMPVAPPDLELVEAPSSRTKRDDRKARAESTAPPKEKVKEPDSDRTAPPPAREPAAAPPLAAIPRPAAASDRLRSALRHQRTRPGEEDIFKSPLVLGLGITGLVALLLTAIFYFIGIRRSTQQEFDIAKQLFTDQKYGQAINEFNGFITRHPDHSLIPEVGRLLGLARIDQVITGAAPNYESGMKILKDFIAEQRESEDFATIQQAIIDRASDIALGAATQAGKLFKKELLDVSRDAKTTLATFAPKEAQPTEQYRQIDAAAAASEAAILKYNTNASLLEQINQALAAGLPLDAFKLRRELLARYPDLERDKRVVDATQKMLDTERGLVKDENYEQPALKEPLTETSGAIRLVYQARIRTDQLSVDRTAPVVAADSVFGIDTITGAPIWRRHIGLDSPFFPVRDVSSNSLILFDAARQELQRVQQNTGEIVWRQPLQEPASGRPLVDEGQVFVPTVGGQLYRFDLQTGAAGGRLTFPQEISNPVALTGGKRIAVAGHREVFYTITKRPFACVAVSYLGQPAGSIEAVVLSMGPYILAAQNQTDGCRLRLLTTEPEDQPIREVAQALIPGQVVDPPVSRGRDLFVPATGERVYAFQVSDDAGQRPLVPGPAYEVKGAKPSATYLAAAPDGEVYMASTALRKLQLSVDALQPTQEAVLLGSASQPLQYLERMMYVARRRPFSESIVFTPIDRATLAGDWQSITGSPILATSVVSGDSPSAVSLTDAGQIYRLTTKLLETGGFLSVAERLILSDELKDPLLARSLGEGQIMVACGAPEPKLWFINRLGQIERTLTLMTPLQAPPALLGNRILAPVAGGIQLLQGTSSQPAAQEFRLPGDIDPVSRWTDVFPVDAENGLAVLDNGMIFGVRFQQTPKPHLAESGRFSLEAPVTGRASFAQPHLAVAAQNGRVVVLESAGLEPVGERQFPAAVSGGPWLVGDLVLVEVGDTELHALSLEDGLPSRWTAPLDGTHVAGTPLLSDGQLIIALQDGRVLAADPGSGTAQPLSTLDATPSAGPVLIGKTAYVPTLDGALVPVSGGRP